MKRVIFGLISAIAIAAVSYLWQSNGGVTEHKSDTGGVQVPVTPKTPSYQQQHTPKRVESVSQTAQAELSGVRVKSINSAIENGSRKVCAYLTTPITEQNHRELARHVEWRPHSPDVRLSVEDGALCIIGDSLIRAHELKLMPSLTLSGSKKLGRTLRVSAFVANLPPLLAFPSQGHVLAVGSAKGIELAVTNVPAVKLELVRVPERAAIAVLDDVYAGRTSLGEYSVESLLDDSATLVWSDVIHPAVEANTVTPVVLAIQDVLKQQSPGLFLLFAAREGDTAAVLPSTVFDADTDIGWSDRAVAQWVLHTNIGATAIKHDNGILLSTRALDTAKPLSAATVSLITHNNDQVFVGKTDRNGFAQIPEAAIRGKRANAPSHLLIQHEQDWGYLQVTSNALDLSDFPLEGRQAPQTFDAYLFTDRGIYRPGENVLLSGIIRDARAELAAMPSLTLRLIKPNGIEHANYPISASSLSAFHRPIELPASAARGLWTLELVANQNSANIMGSVTVDVQDFVPERLRVTLALDKTPQALGEPIAIIGQADFLYGAPATGLNTSTEVSLSTLSSADAKSLRLEGFQLGDAMLPYPTRTLALSEGLVGNGGAIASTTAPFKEPFNGVVKWGQPAQPLAARIALDVNEPGGRPSRAKTSKLLMPSRFIAIRNLESQDVGTTFEVDIKYLDQSLVPISEGTLNWEIMELRYDWVYDRADRRWSYDYQIIDTPIASGTLAANGADAIFGTIPLPALDWGRYVLVVRDKNNRIYAREAWSVGWSNSNQGNRPDFMPVATAKDHFVPGGDIALSITAPFDGEATITVWSDGLQQHSTQRISKGINNLALPTQADWFPGAYVTVQAYRPLSGLSNTETLSADRYIPVRLFGSVYLRAETGRALEVAIAYPEPARARTKLPVTLEIEGLKSTQAYAVIQAVDLGILQLTQFQTPSPLRYFQAKRALNASFFDDYNKLIRADGEVTPLKTGAGDNSAGNSLGIAGLNIIPTKSIVLFEGPVAINADGQATVALDLPDFNGTLRTMAVVWSANQFGATQRDIVLKDPIIAEAVLPRYLAPGDKTEAAIIVANTTDTPTNITLNFSGDDTLNVTKQRQTLHLAAGERATISLPITANTEGVGRLRLSAQSDDGFAITRDWSITSRYAGTGPTLVSDKITLKPQQSLDLQTTINTLTTDSLLSGYVTVAHPDALRVGSALKTLINYPWTCSEQTVSKTWPLLKAYRTDTDFVEKLMAAQNPTQRAKAWIQGNVDRIISRQSSNGAIGLWREGDGLVDPLLSANLVGFLAEAQLSGFKVPAQSIDTAANWSSSLIEKSTLSKPRQAYARAVLFKGLAPFDPSVLRSVRSLADLKNQLTRNTKLNLAVALRHLGDETRAEQLVSDLKNSSAITDTSIYYWSVVHDHLNQAENFYLLGNTEAGDIALNIANQQLADDEYLSVTTAGHLVRVAVARQQLKAGVNIAIDGVNYESALGSVVVPLNAANLVQTRTRDAELRVTSKTGAQLDIRIYLHTQPSIDAQLKQRFEGLALEQAFFDLSGKPLKAAMTALGATDKVVVVSKVTALQNLGQTQILFQHPIPAGFEVDRIIYPDLRDADYPWLPLLSWTDVIEARDDRIIATQLADFSKNEQIMRVAYILRATTPGSYLPLQATAEDMYNQPIMAATEGLSVTVTAKP